LSTALLAAWLLTPRTAAASPMVRPPAAATCSSSFSYERVTRPRDT
jgi:hypothetical protein